MIINWLKREWKQSRCDHQFEIISEYKKLNHHMHHYSWDEMYRLFCPHCDLDIEELKSDYDLEVREERKKEEIERKKEEIRKRVLGGLK